MDVTNRTDAGRTTRVAVVHEHQPRNSVRGWTCWTQHDSTPSHADRVPSRWALELASELLAGPLHAQLPVALERLGGASAADRVYLIEYSAGLDLFRNTWEWSRPGVASFVTDLQNAPVALLGGLHREMRQGNAVAIVDVDHMPADCSALQAEFRRQGNQAVLCLPLMHRGQLRGLFGFDMTHRPAGWTGWGADELAAMFDCAALLGRALYGQGSQPVARAHFAALLYLRNGRRLRGVPLAQIVAVEALRNTSLVHLPHGEVLADSRPLKQWEALLPPADYLRVHRGSIVQLDAVRALDRSVTGQWRLHLAAGDGRVWNVGRQMLGVVRQRLEGAGTAALHASAHLGIDRAPRTPRTTTQP